MARKSVASSIIATIVLGSMMAPTVMADSSTLASATAAQYKIVKHEIIFNGKVVSNPYGIAAPDPNTHKLTTYMPLWYVMQALKAVGVTYTWNGHTLNVQPAATMKVDMSNLKPGTEATQLDISGTLVQTGPKMVMKDPYSHVLTTYVPIFYVMDLLNRLGVKSAWDGNNWTMTLNQTASVTVVAAQTTIGQGQADALTVSVLDNNGNPETVPASALQWNVSNASSGFVVPASLQFLATQPGTYQVTATYSGVTSAPISITVFGATAKIALTPAGTLVANGKSPLTVNVQALDANGTSAANENGTITLTDTQGWLVTGTNNGTDTTAKTVTVQLKNGSGSVQVLAPVTPGLSDTLTSASLTDIQGGATVTYGTLTVTSQAQTATSFQISPVNGQKYLVANSGGSTAQFTVTVLDQAGSPMATGSYAYDISVTGAATYNGPTTGVYVGGQTSLPITVTSVQGNTGTVVVTVSASGLQSADASVQAVIAQQPNKLSASNASGSNTFAEGGGLTYALAGVDPNGYPTTFPATPLTVFVTNAQGTAATNIKVNGQVESSAGLSLNSSQTLNLTDTTNGANAGNYTVIIKDGSGNVWLNQAFTETAGLASQLTLSPSTNEVTEGSPNTNLTVSLADAYGNPVAPATSTSVTVTAQGGSGSATINGQDATKGVAITVGSNGQANIQFIPQSPAGTTWKLTATANGMTSNQATVSIMNTLVASASITMTDSNGSTTQAAAGDVLKFTFGALDSYGNVYQGNDQFAVSFSSGSLLGVQGGVDSNGITTVTGTLSQLQTDFASVKVGSAQVLQVTISDTSVSSARSGTTALQVIAGPFAGFAMFNSANQLISPLNPLPVAANTPIQVNVRPVDAYNNPVNTATTQNVVDLLDAGANGYFRSTPSGANESQLVFPIGAATEPVYYVNGSSVNAVLSAAESTLAPTQSSVSMGAFNKFTSGTNGSGILTVTLRDANNDPVTNQASLLTATVTNGSGVAIGAFTETGTGVYTATVTSTANDTNATITVKDGNTTVGTSNAFNS